MKLVVTWHRVRSINYGRQDVIVTAGYVAHLVTFNMAFVTSLRGTYNSQLSQRSAS
jgi:hypothetical protein